MEYTDDLVLLKKYIKLYYGVDYEDIVFLNNNKYDLRKENLLINKPSTNNILICLQIF